jgi:hypothetical protein
MVTDLARSCLTCNGPVVAAQAAGRPLVALESGIIAHGMPYPENVRTTHEMEALIRDAGAEPATIALFRQIDPARLLHMLFPPCHQCPSAHLIRLVEKRGVDNPIRPEVAKFLT